MIGLKVKDREKLMSAVYACICLSTSKSEDVINSFDPVTVLTDIFDLPLELINPYALEIYSTVLTKQTEIVPAIEVHLHNWKFNRLNNVTKAILLVAYAEGVILKHVDRVIIINQAVSLAKKFVPNDKDYKFVNAVLDKIL